MKLLATFLLLSLLSAPLGSPQSAALWSPNQQARFLAGLPGNGFENRSGWKEHAAALDQAWIRKEQSSLTPIRNWALGRQFYGHSGTVFYFFSGPDALYAQTFFPGASTYILCGTEPVGPLPNVQQIPEPALDGALGNLRQSMSTMLSFHYFITKDMRRDLQRAQLGGTLPIIYVFLARMGATIDEVSLLRSPAPGVRVSFHRTGSSAQTLYYFQTNLANGANPAFLRWCASQGPAMSLVKSASYLMHQQNFSQARRFLLEQSRVIVQDDSGVPLQAFDQRWDLRFFGSYQAPIELFAKHLQPDLVSAFQRAPSQPLAFAFGYHWQKERSLLILATRR